jgi:hypothetical protein
MPIEFLQRIEIKTADYWLKSAANMITYIQTDTNTVHEEYGMVKSGDRFSIEAGKIVIYPYGTKIRFLNQTSVTNKLGAIVPLIKDEIKSFRSGEEITFGEISDITY